MGGIPQRGWGEGRKGAGGFDGASHEQSFLHVAPTKPSPTRPTDQGDEILASSQISSAK